MSRGAGSSMHAREQAALQSKRLAGMVVLAISFVLAIAAVAMDGASASSENEEMLQTQGLREGIEALSEAESQLEAWLESPEAAAERSASRFAYADATGDEVESLIRDLFASQLKELNGDPGRSLSEETLVHPSGEFAAAVEREGRLELLESSIPIRVEDDDGELRKVNLDLEPSGDRFEPTNPLTAVSLPSDGAEAVRLGDDGLAFAAVGADAGSAAKRFGDRSMLYPDLYEDTDRLVAPTTMGVEFFDLLRSESSPEQIRYRLQLPEGADLRADDSGGAEIVDREVQLARILPPEATDAQGADVAVEMDVEGRDFVLSVPHRELDLAYPILVDPPVWENWYTANWASGAGLEVLEPPNEIWQYSSTHPSIIASTYCLYACWPSSGRGLFVSTKNDSYPAGAWGRWVYSAPNVNSYIAGAQLYPFYRDNHGCSKTSYQQPDDYVGLWGDSTWIQLQYNLANSQGYANLPEWGRSLHVGLTMAGQAVTIPCWRDIYVGGVLVYLDDWAPPTLNSVSAPPTAWIDGKTPFTITAKASDVGLGVQNITISPEGAAIIPSVPPQNQCPGTRMKPCPATYTGNFTLTGASFDEGIKKASLSANDPTGDVSATSQWQMKVDRSEPTVTLGGQLAVVTDEDEGDQNDPAKWDQLSLPVYNLSIQATDGSLASDVAKRSGVKSVAVFLDQKEAPEKEWQQACPGSSCPMTQSYPLRLNELAPGKHTLKVVVGDQVSNKRTREIEFEYLPATGLKDSFVFQHFQLPDGADHKGEETWQGPELAVNLMNGNLVYRQQDVDIEGPNVDLEVERFYNSQLPTSENTEWGDGWTLAQTPELDPVDTGGTPAPDEAGLLDTSGAMDEGLQLPAVTGESKFDPELQASLTKQAGGFELADEGDGSESTIVFDAAGRVEELDSGGTASVEYDYEAGDLAELSVEDPAYTAPPAPPPTGVVSSPGFGRAFSILGPGTAAFPPKPTDIARTPQGNLCVLDRASNNVQCFNPNGVYLSKFGAKGSGNGQLSSPSAIALDPKGSFWIADTGNNRIQQFNAAGAYLMQVGTLGSGNGQFKAPEGIAVDPKGNVWVSDTGNGRVQKFNDKGEFVKSTGSKGTGPLNFGEPVGIDYSPKTNTAWVADRSNNRIARLSENGAFINQFGTPGSGNGQFNAPEGIAFDSAPTIVWVLDRGNSRVQKFNIGGTFLAQFGQKGTAEGQFSFSQPTGLIADSSNGLWIADQGSYKVQKWFTSHPVEPAPPSEDPAVNVQVDEGMVSSLEGDEATELTYDHTGDDLASVAGPEGETGFKYDASGRLTEIILANETTATIAYGGGYERVSSVVVDPGGPETAKTTSFSYLDEPRRTTVTPVGEPVVTYDFAADGSVLKWSNVVKPPTIGPVGGNLWANRETAAPIAAGDYNLVVPAFSPEGVASIQVIADGDQLVTERECKQDPGTPQIDCLEESKEWITSTSSHPAGILELEVLVVDRLGSEASQRFWVNIPYTPPPQPGVVPPPSFAQIQEFRQEFGLDLDLTDELARNDRIFDLIGAWNNPQTPAGEVARSSAERWGVPLRPVDVAELEYREAFVEHDGPLIDEWGELHAPTSYAGYHVDHAAGGLFKVGFTSNQSSLLSELKSQTALMAPPRLAVYASEPSRSLSSLVSTTESIEVAATTNSTLDNEMVSVGVSEAGNTVEVGATNVAQVKSTLESLLGAGAPVTVIYEAPIEGQSGRNQDSGHIFAGDRILGTVGGGARECTAGFGAWEDRNKKSNGEPIRARFLLTAAHCYPTGTTIKRSSQANVKDPSKWKVVGDVNRTGAPYGGQHYETDASGARLGDGLAPHYIHTERFPLAVRQAVAPRHGQLLCVSGGTSDMVDCGRMTGIRNVSTDLPGRTLLIVVHGLHTVGGDSGAPLWNARNSRAVGLLHGDSDTRANVRFFTPLAKPRGFPIAKVPGALNAPGMGDLHLIVGP